MSYQALAPQVPQVRRLFGVVDPMPVGCPDPLRMLARGVDYIGVAVVQGGLPAPLEIAQIPGTGECLS